MLCVIGFNCAVCIDPVCAPTEVAASDYASVGSIQGIPGRTFDITCDPGYIGGGTITCGNDLIFTQVTCTSNVLSHQKISMTAGGLTYQLAANDYFGTFVDVLEDFDMDGIAEVAVGNIYDSSVAIIFLNKDGTVRSHQKISSSSGDFTGKTAHP